MKLTGLTASVINGYIDGFAAEFKLAAAKKYKKSREKQIRRYRYRQREAVYNVCHKRF